MKVDGPAMVTRQLDLNLGLETGAADDLRVEVFGRQEHDGVGHCGGRVDVLVTDALAFGADGSLEGTASSGYLFG